MKKYMTKCVHCGKARQHHNAGHLNCPMGAYSRTLGYTSFDRTKKFEQDLKGWTPVVKGCPEPGVYVMCATFFDGPHDFRYRPGYLDERTTCSFILDGASWTTTHWRKLTSKERRMLEDKDKKDKKHQSLEQAYAPLILMLREKFSQPVFNSRFSNTVFLSKDELDAISPIILSDTPIARR